MPLVCLAILAGDFLLAQITQQLLQGLANSLCTALEGAGLNGPVQRLQLIVWYANSYLL